MNAETRHHRGNYLLNKIPKLEDRTETFFGIPIDQLSRDEMMGAVYLLKEQLKYVEPNGPDPARFRKERLTVMKIFWLNIAVLVGQIAFAIYFFS